MTLEGRVAIVTGPAGTAGPAVVRMLVDEGARVGLVGSRRERLEALAADLELPADRWIAAAADLRVAGQAASSVDAIAERFGRLDVLVHLVGGWTGGTSLVETPDERFSSMLDQHLWTTLGVLRAVVPRLTAAGWGRIVAVSSPVAGEPPGGMAAYAVGKAAEETLLASLASELAGSGVTVNVLLARSITGDGPGASGSGRSATSARQIAAAIRYLCSEEAGVVNGARLPMTGRR